MHPPLVHLIILHFNPQEKYITMVTQFPSACNEIIITKPCRHLFLFSPEYSFCYNYMAVTLLFSLYSQE